MDILFDHPGDDSMIYSMIIEEEKHNRKGKRRRFSFQMAKTTSVMAATAPTPVFHHHEITE